MKNVNDDRNLKALATETEGLTTVEYVIVLVLIAILGIGIWRTFGASVRSQVSQSNTQINNLDNR